MTYKCKRCGKTAKTTAGLHCQRCDLEDARLAGTHVEFTSPPGFNEVVQTDSSPAQHDSYSGGGGDFGGGGASGDY